MNKQIAQLFYKLSVFFDYNYAEHLKKSQMYDELKQELSQSMMETINMISIWEQGNLKEVLPIRCDAWGAINDALNYLVLNLIAEIKQLPNDSHLRHKFQIYETLSSAQKINNNTVNNEYLTDFEDWDDFGDLENLDDVDENSDRNIQNHRQKKIFTKIQESIIRICGKPLGKLFFSFSIIFDKKYLEHLRKSQRYEQLSENLSRQIISMLDIVESWARFDFRERIEINYIYDFQDVVITLNTFIDTLTQDIKKLPDNCSFKQKVKY